MTTEALSSRICVKGIPKRCDEKRLREHFESRGSEVTDVRVMRTKEGKSRLFGFVGFRSPEQAEEARAYFARSFIDTSRLQIELAKPQGHSELARPWSRHSKGSSAYSRAHPDDEDDEAAGGGAGGGGGAESAKPDKPGAVQKAGVVSAAEQRARDAKLEEFLGLMQPNSKKKMRLWSNDDTAGAAAAGDAAAAKASGDPELDGGESDDDYEEVEEGQGEAEGGEEGDGGGGGVAQREEEEEDPWAAEAEAASKGFGKWKTPDVVGDEAAGKDTTRTKKKGKVAVEEGAVGGGVHAAGMEEEMEEEEGEEAGGEEEEGGGGEWGGGEEATAANANAEEELVDGLDEGRLFVRNLPYLATEPGMSDTQMKF